MSNEYTTISITKQLKKKLTSMMRKDQTYTEFISMLLAYYDKHKKGD